jgi:hypothetical protein
MKKWMDAIGYAFAMTYPCDDSVPTRGFNPLPNLGNPVNRIKIMVQTTKSQFRQ